MPTPYERSAYDRVVGDLIQSDLQSGLATNTITLSPPSIVDQFDRNTKITINIHEGAKLVNCLGSFINREFLDDVLGPLNVAAMDISSYTTTHDLLDDLFDQYEVRLDPEDILLEQLADNGGTITAAPNSYGWIGTFTFTADVLIYPPLIRSRSERLLVTRSGKFLRALYPTYPPLPPS